MNKSRYNPGTNKYRVLSETVAVVEFKLTSDDRHPWITSETYWHLDSPS